VEGSRNTNILKKGKGKTYEKAVFTMKKGKSYKPQKPTAKTPSPGRQVGFRGFVDSSGNYGYYTKNPNN